MISASSSPLNVVEAMRNGATDFLGKPISQAQLGEAIGRALADAAVASSQPEPSAEPETTVSTRNPAMQRIQTLVDRIAWSDAPVLIQGETGVGKEVLARQLHAQSRRANKPLLKLNCAALPSELVESELFGYERGAFTGAFQRKLGMFEQADQGTILLDEIGDMDHKLQAKLLQVLQDHEFMRVGGRATIRVDVRVIAATHRDLEQAIAEGTFREDLYYRLNVISLRLPALRDRKEDILALAEVLLQKHAIPGQPVPTLPPMLQEALVAYDWPGNIRELENVMRKLIVLGDAQRLASELFAKTSRKLQVAQPQVAQAPAALVESASNGSQLHALEPQTGRGPSADRLQSAPVQDEKAADRGSDRTRPAVQPSRLRPLPHGFGLIA
jgi:two-component system, NtrC family, response regulator AtoC